VSRRGAEPKPPWSAVPRQVKEEVARVLGSPVARASRIYGGYAPSATFRLALADGRRAFFKGVSARSNEFMRGALVQEERVYRELSHLIRPWAPEFYDSLQVDDWHALLLEDVGPADVPPWTARKVRDAAQAYAKFHRSTLGRPLPEWVTSDLLPGEVENWERLAADDGALAATASLAGPRAPEARAWLEAHLPRLSATSRELLAVTDHHTLLYLDARGDNVRWNQGQLRIFDWNWVQRGPVEPDAAAFAEGIAAEGGPAPEMFMAEYGRAMPVRGEALRASVAVLAGFFARSAPRPPMPGLPRIRSIQRRQLKVCLAWAARLLELPEPRWLAAVAD
jgi:hypothetical protein